jgi:hypothetical protein
MARSTSLAAALLLTASAAVAEPTPKLEGTLLRVEGITTGGEVAVLGVWREPVRSGPHATQTNIEETLVDDDSDGVVELELPRNPPLVALFAVIDMTTGESALVGHEQFRFRTIAAGKEAAFSKQLGRVLIMRRELQVLVVRPGGGRWRGRARDGAPADVDSRPDQAVTLALDRLDNEGKDDPGPKLLAGDTVIAIDPVQMDAFNLRLQ